MKRACKLLISQSVVSQAAALKKGSNRGAETCNVLVRFFRRMYFHPINTTNPFQ